MRNKQCKARLSVGYELNMDKKDILRPIYGTIVFQPFAFLWAWLTGAPFLTEIGPFVIYSTVVFIPIYAIYERYYDRLFDEPTN